VVDIGFYGVLVSRLTYSVVDIGFCGVLVSRLTYSVVENEAVLSRKSKDWFSQNKVNMSKLSDLSISGLLIVQILIQPLLFA
jgi:hypothetical protein